MIGLVVALLSSVDGSSIPTEMHGAWVPIEAECSSAVDRLEVSRDRLHWYESTGYLQLGIEFLATGIDKGFYAKVVGTNVDGQPKFWESMLKMEVTSSNLQIVRQDETGKEIASVHYKPCS